MIVRKLDCFHQTKLTWEAVPLVQTDAYVQLEAYFAGADRLELGYTVFERGDRFVEWYYFDRYYNVYAIYGQGSGALRGWYCNIARPAQLMGEEVQTVDLALDLWVAADGGQLVLDEAEFAALPLTATERMACEAALAELQQAVQNWDAWQALYSA